MFGNTTSQFAQCPKCSSKIAQEVRFTWWGGALGPKLFNHVKCQTCGKTYNGDTGKDNNMYIAIYFIVSAIALAVMFSAFGIFSYLK